ncbi:MAG: hypothetical protein F9K25_20280 [Candidatus Contendobacter sp.]|nr:MAG: hypothetical protein F9K25_20280 [Candidatus Contendobacter sp.]
MQLPKLKVLAEAGAVREVEVIHDQAAGGWTVQVTYASRHGERREVLERQRGGARVFTTLDAVARALAGLGLTVFRVNATGLAGAVEDPP